MSRIDETIDFIPVRIAVLTVSDTRGLAEDRSGDVLGARELTNAATGTTSAPDMLSTDAMQDATKPSNATAPQNDLITEALAQADFSAGLDLLEREMLARLYPDYPSSRKLAERLGVSHTSIANKLRKYGIGT